MHHHRRPGRISSSDGITQISVTAQTAEETNFAEKLRAVLRLDPDIVMVGEIRDTGYSENCAPSLADRSPLYFRPFTPVQLPRP